MAKASGRTNALTRIYGVCGISAQLVALAALLLTLSRSPWFSWTEDDISLLGAEGAATTIFNGGLVLAGLLSLIFVIGLGRSFLSNRLGRLGMTSLVLGAMAISAIGIFPRTIRLAHNLASAAFFVFIPLAIFIIGIRAITAGRMVLGSLSLIAAFATIALLLAPWPWPGGAISQLLAYLPWSLWAVALGVGLLVRPDRRIKG